MPAYAAGMYDIHEHGWGGGNCRVVHYCYRPPQFDVRWGDVNKKTEKYLFDGSSAVEEIMSSEET